MSESVVRLKPMEYVHVHDNNSGIAFLICGPQTVTLPSHQSLLCKPQPFHVIPPQCYSVMENPIARDEAGEPVKDKHGQIKNVFGEREVRFHQLPFPLYPEEKVVESKPLVVLNANQALVLKATRTRDDISDPKNPVKRNAGDEYLFCGPATYIPRVDEDIQERRDAVIVKFNEAIKLRAKNKFTDKNKVTRHAGEEYLISQPGAYMVGVDEQLITKVSAIILTPEKAIHVEVKDAFRDDRPWAKIDRKPGEVYLVTNKMTSEFIPHPAEYIQKPVPLTKVSRKQWTVILDPVGPDGKPQMGSRKVVTNTQFFLEPGERLESHGVKDVYVLGDDEAVLLVALEEFEDIEQDPPLKRISGEQWLLAGPREYIPNRSVRVKKEKDGSEKRKRLVLSNDDGVYVRDIQTGEVRAIVGQTYMLQAYEELWEKELPAVVEEKLTQQLGSHAAYMEKVKLSSGRDKTHVVSYHIPHNAVTQVYDYKKRSQRTIFGPDCVVLGPDEQFTVLNLSGSEWDLKRPTVCLPKETGKIKALYMFLGPASLSDVVNVETRDHARLSLQLSYDWYFEVEPGNAKQADECFSVPDFVGDCCSCIASRVRASIASITFDDFHRYSSRILQAAVFGIDKETKQPKKELRFPANRLIVTSVDIQEIEVTDKKTRDALAQSVKMAIEITTQGQEASARQEASVREQKARGMLDRQQIKDKSQAEVERKKLIELQTMCSAIENTGQAKAEARARADAAAIEGSSSVQLARVKVKKNNVMDNVQLEVRLKKGQQEIEYFEKKTSTDIYFQKAMSDIESGKFGHVMNAVGRDTVTAMAQAGPEMQAKLLAAMGLEGYLVTDGTNPINLFNTAQGMAGATNAGTEASAPQK